MDFKLLIKQDFDIELTDLTLSKFETYYDFLTEYNTHTNLTRITDKESAYIKHFYDSLLLMKVTDIKDKSICDVGAGAGFPSIPLKLMDDSLSVKIIDSLGKRITFLNELKDKLELSDVSAEHARAEEFAHKNREGFDIVTARAVARLNILVELCLPLVKVGGCFVALKGSSLDTELEEALVGIKILGGEILSKQTFELPNEMGTREILVIKKVSETTLDYPRTFGIIKKKPL